MAKQATVISHWYQLIEGFHSSSVGLYTEIEAALTKREVPELNGSRVEYKESGLGSANRQYLRIIRGTHSFDICAAPFGTGFFFSWWLTDVRSSFGLLYLIGLLFVMSILSLLSLWMGITMAIFFNLFGIPLLLWFAGMAVRERIIDAEDIVLAMPIVGWLYLTIFSPPTYYKIDTALMFQEAVHNAVLEVIDKATCSQGVKTLSEPERKPILKSFSQSA